jgi:hypothetical protein
MGEGEGGGERDKGRNEMDFGAINRIAKTSFQKEVSVCLKRK